MDANRSSGGIRCVLIAALCACPIVKAQQPASFSASGSFSASPNANPFASSSASLAASRNQSSLTRRGSGGLQGQSRGVPFIASRPRGQQTDLSIYPLPVQPVIRLGQETPASGQLSLPRVAGEPREINPILAPTLTSRDLESTTGQTIRAGGTGYRQPSFPESPASAVIGIPEPFTANAEAAYVAGLANSQGGSHNILGHSSPSHSRPTHIPAHGTTSTSSFHP